MSFWLFRKWTSTLQDGFKAGYNEAWRSMSPLVTQGIESGRRVVETIAIEQTMKRLSQNGSHTKKKWRFPWFNSHN